MEVLKAHENVLNIAIKLQKISTTEKLNMPLQKVLKRMSHKMTTDMIALAKTLPWKDKMTYARMNRVKNKQEEGNQANESKQTTATIPPKKKVWLKWRTAPKFFVKEHTENLQSTVWKHKFQ